MSDYTREPGVDIYLEDLPDWQMALGQDLRNLLHSVDDEIVETIKRRVQPYFVLQGNVCAFLGTKDHFNLFLYDGAIVADPDGIITSGHENKTARMISFFEGDAIPRQPLVRMIEEIIANNRAGGWRKIKAAEEA